MQERAQDFPGERAGVVVMTPDLWVLAVVTALCCLLVAAFGIAERQRFTAAPGRHRRRMSRSEIVMQAREVLYTVGYCAFGLYVVAATLLAPLVRWLHLRDRWRERRLWAVKTAPVVQQKKDAPVAAAASPWRHGPLLLTVDLGYLGTRSVVL
jgi:hypothetical protein